MGIGLFRKSLVGLAAVCCVLFLQGAARANRSERVAVVRAEEMDWPEGRRAVEDELLASGYRVEHSESRALDVGVLLDELASPAPEDIAARVTILRVGRTGIAYVWLLASERTHRVTSGEPDPVRAANILSLRVVELIELGTEGVDFQPADAAPTEKQPSSAGNEGTRTVERGDLWLLLAGGGITMGDGLVAPVGSLEMIAGRRLVGLLGMEASFSLGLNGSSRSFEGGTIRARRQRGAVGLFLWSHDSPWWQVGINSGVECYQFAWTAETSKGSHTNAACVPSSSLLGRVGARWSNVATWLAGSVSMSHRRVRLIESGDVLATFGQPEGTLSGGVGWSF